MSSYKVHYTHSGDRHRFGKNQAKNQHRTEDPGKVFPNNPDVLFVQCKISRICEKRPKSHDRG